MDGERHPCPRCRGSLLACARQRQGSASGHVQRIHCGRFTLAPGRAGAASCCVIRNCASTPPPGDPPPRRRAGRNRPRSFPSRPPVSGPRGPAGAAPPPRARFGTAAALRSPTRPPAIRPAPGSHATSWALPPMILTRSRSPTVATAPGGWGCKPDSHGRFHRRGISDRGCQPRGRSSPDIARKALHPVSPERVQDR